MLLVPMALITAGIMRNVSFIQCFHAKQWLSTLPCILDINPQPIEWEGDPNDRPTQPCMLIEANGYAWHMVQASMPTCPAHVLQNDCTPQQRYDQCPICKTEFFEVAFECGHCFCKVPKSLLLPFCYSIMLLIGVCRPLDRMCNLPQANYPQDLAIHWRHKPKAWLWHIGTCYGIWYPEAAPGCMSMCCKYPISWKQFKRNIGDFALDWGFFFFVNTAIPYL